RVLDASLDEVHRNRPQVLCAARRAHQPARAKSPSHQQLQQMIADESAGAGNENGSHLSLISQRVCGAPVTPGLWQTYHLRSQRMRRMRSTPRSLDCPAIPCLLPGAPSERKTGRREGLLSPSVEVKTTPELR